MDCTVEQASIQAASLAGDRGRLPPLLDEVSHQLQGSVVHFELTPSGRVTGIDFDDGGDGSRRTRRVQANLLLLVQRSFMGFDFGLPARGYSASGSWGQYDAAWMTALAMTDANGKSELAHKAHGTENAAVVRVETLGRGAIAPDPANPAPVDYYETSVEAVTLFDTAVGHALDRTWAVRAVPTTTSAVHVLGIPYEQHGHLRWLAQDEAVSLPPNAELTPPGREGSTLPAWKNLNAKP